VVPTTTARPTVPRSFSYSGATARSCEPRSTPVRPACRCSASTSDTSGFSPSRPRGGGGDDQGSHRRPLRGRGADDRRRRGVASRHRARDVVGSERGVGGEEQRERVLGSRGCRRRAFPLLRFGCDGVLCATRTGSTDMPIRWAVPDPVWPNVDALLVVPNAAHALFARRSSCRRRSVIDVELLREDHPVLACDGRRWSTSRPGAELADPFLIAHVFGPGIAEDREGPVGAAQSMALP